MCKQLIHVMIVEDEYLVRLGLRTVINWEQNGLKLVCDSANGDDGLAKFIKFRPSIVITDIKMPGIDGLELTKKIKSIDPKVEIIILSSHDDFDLVRTSLRFGASDYLIKAALDPEELLRSIKKLIKIKKISPLLQQDTVLNTVESNIFYSKILSTNNPLGDAEEILSLLKVTKKENGQTIYIKLIKNSRSSSQDSSMALNSVISLITEIYGTNIVIDISKDNFILILLKSNFDTMVSRTNRLLKLSSSYLEIDYYCFLSTEWYTSSGLLHSIRNSQENIINGFIYGPGVLFFKKDNITKLSIYQSDIKDKIQYLAGIILTDSFDDINRIMGDIHANIICLLPNEKALSIFLEELLDYIIIFINLRKGFSIDKNSVFFNLKNKTDFNYLLDYLNYLSVCIMNELDVKEYSVQSGIIKKTIKKLCFDYSKILSLDEIAEEVRLSSNYLCSKFKKESNLNITAFLNLIRIGHALFIMKSDPSVKIYEVSSKCGFSDSTYFSRIFKSLVQLTPSQYLKS